ncbi:MAG: group 1 glycosyl transferase [Candidatus Berkelbacteria bacterium]|nr:group 1 glycosyl transferase [Candidatus Berkelbacteria bacterium]
MNKKSVEGFTLLIGIDASRTAKQFKTGTETYSTELIKTLNEIDRKNKYILYTPRDLSEKLPNLGSNFKQKILPFGKLWTQVRLSWEMLTNTKPDILFVPAHTLPMVMPEKSVVTLHDLGFKYFPELYSQTDINYHNWAMGHSVKHARHIIAISEFTKKDIMKYFTVDPTKITVIYEGFDQGIFKPLKNKKKSEKPYILFIGRLEDKKNIIGMIKAYAILRKEKNIRHQFILAGGPGFGYEKIQLELAKLPKEIRQDIILPGYVSQEEYVRLLKSADILFFCTFFEGFGLPPLEAMACSVPVVASNRTSIPEICSKAALLVNPENPFDMAVALSKIINNAGVRKALISKGIARASLFSWKKCAQKTLEVLEKVYCEK